MKTRELILSLFLILMSFSSVFNARIGIDVLGSVFYSLIMLFIGILGLIYGFVRVFKIIKDDIKTKNLKIIDKNNGFNGE